MTALALGAQTPYTTLAPATPAEVGMSAVVLDSAVALYRAAVDSGHLVGAVLLVARNGRIVVHEAIGHRQKELRLPMEKNTMFRMASNVKPVVATAAAMLYERGRLRFDDSVKKFVPTFDNWKSRAITIHHLLTHTSGLRINGLFLQPLMKKSDKYPGAPNLQLEVARFGDIGPKEKPGATYSYSNPGFNTLGAVIEIASGKSLETFLRDEIYQKLGMSDTYNHETAQCLGAKLQRMSAVYYQRNEAGNWFPGWKPGDPPQVPFVRASGGMISTAWDYAIFLQTFLNGGAYGNVRLLRPETVKLMTRNYSPRAPNHPPTSEFGYGYGWALEGVAFTHHGSDGTFAWVDPTRGIIGEVLTQTPNGKNPQREFVELVKRAIVDRRAE